MTAEAVEAVRMGVEQVKGVITTLTPEEWAMPSRCQGWRVQDLVAHMSSNFKETVSPSPAPDPPPAARPRAEAVMEMLVDPRRDWTPEQVRDEYLAYCDGAVAVLASLQDEPMASTVIPLADLGSYPTHQLADAYAFDHYCHLRVDLLAPDGPISRPVPPADDIALGTTIGWMRAGLPQMQPGLEEQVDAGAPLRLTLTGPGGGSWLISREGGGLRVAPGATGEIAEITSDGHAFVLWGTTRSPWRDHCTVSGDEAAATRFLDALNII